MEDAKNEKVIALNNIKNLKNEVEKTIQKQLQQQTLKTEQVKALLETIKSPTINIELQCVIPSCGEKIKVTLSSGEGTLICSKCKKIYKFANLMIPQETDLPNIEKQINILKDNIHEIEQKIKGIREKIENIKAGVLSDAHVIATTLTKMHIAPELYKNQYDVVILDEASMAPLPSIFFTAGLSKEKYIIIGDFC